jgi:ectoine hydroxylase-related dioxygenase (phytanoyl-CoA dioxygenase family)
MSVLTETSSTGGKPKPRCTLETLASRARPEEIIGLLERDGAVIVRDFLDVGTVDALNRDFDPYIQAKPAGAWRHPNDQYGEGSFAGERTKRVGGLAAKSRTFVGLVSHPTLLACADHFLKPNCGSYYLNGTQLMVVGPGAARQLPHRDEEDWPHFPHPRPHLVINFMFALSDFRAANGATSVVPGSHRWDDYDRLPVESEITQAIMERGSVLFYTGKVIHGSSTNSTLEEWRRGMWFAYCLGWLRQYENQYLATPPDVARNFPKIAQELLGYKLHDPSPLRGGLIGGVDLGVPGENDPAQVLT